MKEAKGVEGMEEGAKDRCGLTEVGDRPTYEGGRGGGACGGG